MIEAGTRSEVARCIPFTVLVHIIHNASLPTFAVTIVGDCAFLIRVTDAFVSHRRNDWLAFNFGFPTDVMFVTSAWVLG